MFKLLRKLALLLRRDRFRSELDEEMAFHRAEAEQSLIAVGMAPKAARRAARRQFGNETRLREQSHEAVAFRLETVLQVARYALRQMMRAPGFTLAVVLTLALGIGANTAIFSVVHATLLRPLPYPDADRIVGIQDKKIQGVSTGGLMGVPRFYDLTARSQSFDKLTCFYFDHPSMIDGKHTPEKPEWRGVAGPFWRLFGVQPMLGQAFEEDNNHPHAGAVAVLSYAAWERLFAGDPGKIGKAVLLDKRSSLATIIRSAARRLQLSARRRHLQAIAFSALRLEELSRRRHSLRQHLRTPQAECNSHRRRTKCASSRPNWPRSTPTPTPPGALKARLCANTSTATYDQRSWCCWRPQPYCC